MSRVVVITSDVPLSKIQLPIAKSRLEAVSKSGGFNSEEEQKVCQWCMSVSVTGIDCEVTEDRLKEIIGTPERTKSYEDTVLSEWVLLVWAAIESMKHRA